jgi:hypothetical protein
VRFPVHLSRIRRWRRMEERVRIAISEIRYGQADARIRISPRRYGARKRYSSWAECGRAAKWLHHGSNHASSIRWSGLRDVQNPVCDGSAVHFCEDNRRGMAQTNSEAPRGRRSRPTRITAEVLRSNAACLSVKQNPENCIKHRTERFGGATYRRHDSDNHRVRDQPTLVEDLCYCDACA